MIVNPLGGSGASKLVEGYECVHHPVTLFLSPEESDQLTRDLVPLGQPTPDHSGNDLNRENPTRPCNSYEPESNESA